MEFRTDLKIKVQFKEKTNFKEIEDKIFNEKITSYISYNGLRKTWLHTSDKWWTRNIVRYITIYWKQVPIVYVSI